MVKLTPENLKVPIRVKVGKANTFYLNQGKTIIYFTGHRFEWCMTELTPILIEDMSQIFGTPDRKNWVGKEIEVFSKDGQIRARLTTGKDQEND